jgi:superfamily II DNA helicase RecQ
VADGRRVLVMQRTGWDKSAVYFLATRLLRAAGAGPVHPLALLSGWPISANNHPVQDG